MRNFVTIFLIMSFILLLQGCTQSKSISQKDNSNNLKKINNPSKINQYIKEPEYTIIRTNRYYATDNATYIRCDIYLEPTVCYVKKLYIGESTKPFYENEYSSDNTLDSDVMDSIIWITENDILVNGLYLYNIPTETFYEFNTLTTKIKSILIIIMTLLMKMNI